MMNGQSSAPLGSNDVKYPPNVGRGLSTAELDVDKLYEPKQNKKIVRIFTVILYMFSVSLGAILLSLYYVFIWKNPHTKDMEAAGQDNFTELGSGYLMLDTSSLGPEALILSDPDNLNLHLHDEDGEAFPATAFPKKARGVPPVMDHNRQKRAARKGLSLRQTKGKHKNN